MPKPKIDYKKYRSARGQLTSSQRTVVRELAKGQVNVGHSFLTGQTYNSGVEVTPLTWSATAGGGDKLYAYIRMNFGVASLAGGAKVIRWFLARWVIADGTPDLSTADTLEQFQKDRRIIKRGWYLTGGWPSSMIRGLGFSVRNIRIPDGERLGLVVYNDAASVADMVEWYDFEQREITIS